MVALTFFFSACNKDQPVADQDQAGVVSVKSTCSPTETPLGSSNALKALYPQPGVTGTDMVAEKEGVQLWKGKGNDHWIVFPENAGDYIVTVVINQGSDYFKLEFSSDCWNGQTYDFVGYKVSGIWLNSGWVKCVADCPCVTDTDCGDGFYCEDGECVPYDTCINENCIIIGEDCKCTECKEGFIPSETSGKCCQVFKISFNYMADSFEVAVCPDVDCQKFVFPDPNIPVDNCHEFLWFYNGVEYRPAEKYDDCVDGNIEITEYMIIERCPGQICIFDDDGFVRCDDPNPCDACGDDQYCNEEDECCKDFTISFGTKAEPIVLTVCGDASCPDFRFPPLTSDDLCDTPMWLLVGTDGLFEPDSDYPFCVESDMVFQDTMDPKDCPTGEHCENGVCVPDDPCANTPPCPWGEYCDGGVCVPCTEFSNPSIVNGSWQKNLQDKNNTKGFEFKVALTDCNGEEDFVVENVGKINAQQKGNKTFLSKYGYSVKVTWNDNNMVTGVEIVGAPAPAPAPSVSKDNQGGNNNKAGNGNSQK